MILHHFISHGEGPIPNNLSNKLIYKEEENIPFKCKKKLYLIKNVINRYTLFPSRPLIKEKQPSFLYSKLFYIKLFLKTKKITKLNWVKKIIKNLYDNKICVTETFLLTTKFCVKMELVGEGTAINGAYTVKFTYIYPGL